MARLRFILVTKLTTQRFSAWNRKWEVYGRGMELWQGGPWSHGCRCWLALTLAKKEEKAERGESGMAHYLSNLSGDLLHLGHGRRTGWCVWYNVLQAMFIFSCVWVCVVICNQSSCVFVFVCVRASWWISHQLLPADIDCLWNQRSSG